MTLPEIICPHCHIQFKPTRIDQKFCNPICRIKFDRYWQNLLRKKPKLIILKGTYQKQN